VRFAFILVERVNHGVVILCRVLEVSRSGFYSWRGRPVSATAKANMRMTTEIAAVHKRSRSTYGSPRVHAELLANGHIVSRNRVSRLMRLEGIHARRKRRFRITTDSKHSFPIAPNELARDFEVGAPNVVWVTDITYVETREGWLYLAAILDLFSRRVVGWATSDSLSTQLALDALAMGLRNRRPCKGLIHHSDRGSQYASDDYRKALSAAGIDRSMSRKGDCWDNAVAESFFSTIKTELIHEADFLDRASAAADIDEYIRVFYNHQRRHSHNSYVSPVEFELKAQIVTKAA
jgi:transposase InsO family protein